MEGDIRECYPSYRMMVKDSIDSTSRIEEQRVS